MFPVRDRFALFIDGANLYATSKGLRWEIDYARVLSYYARRGRLVRASYYTALLDEAEHSHLRPLVDYLQYNGYRMVTKLAKSFTNDVTGVVKTKGNMDIELAIDAMKMAINRCVDTIVLFSGDGDFKAMVEFVQDLGVRVEVVSSLKVGQAMIADELRRQCDEFIELSTMKPHFERNPKGDDY